MGHTQTCAHNEGPCTWNAHTTQTIDIFCLILQVMMSQFQQLHNLVLNMIQFSFPALMGTHVECGFISLFTLLVHLHISPWEWQHREQPDIIIHRLECTQPHSTPIIKVYFASSETCWVHDIHVHVINRELFAWSPLRWEWGFYVLSRREEHGWGTRELLSHQINNW